MATITRESAAGRDKRCTAQRRNGLEQSKTRAPAQNQDSEASEKQIPNYLKPTISSGHDVSTPQGKKPVLSDNAHKPALARRRSFDKPLSPSLMQKARISPNQTLRSHSFSSKTSAPKKAVPDKHSKASKDVGKQSPLYARPIGIVKKSRTYDKKQGTGSNAETAMEEVTSPPERVYSSDTKDVLQPETRRRGQESPISGAEEEITQVESSIKMGTQDSAPVLLEQTEAESDKDIQVETAVSTVSEQEDISLGVKAEEPENSPQIEETHGNNHPESEEHALNEINISKTDERALENPITEAEEKDEEQAETAAEKKEVAANGSEAHECKETEVQDVAGEEKQEAESKTEKQQRAQIKKDSAVSNDVIEETASKLREQRKNKVKALAGAFETVISLQETK